MDSRSPGHPSQMKRYSRSPGHPSRRNRETRNQVDKNTRDNARYNKMRMGRGKRTPTKKDPRDNARYNKMRMGRGKRTPPISNDQVIIGNTNIESSDPRDDVTDQPKKLSETEINTLASNKAKRDQMLNMREHMKVAQQDETFYNDAILRNQQQKLKVGKGNV